jgi:lysophospholipase L1-like esterase
VSSFYRSCLVAIALTFHLSSLARADFIWVAASNGYAPPDAMVAGQDEGGEALYVCRVNFNDSAHAGKVRSGLGGCNIGWGGREYSVPNYEVLVERGTNNDKRLTWVTARDGSIPADAVSVGLERGTQIALPMYVCRGRTQKGLHSGKIRSDFRTCNIGFGGIERLINPYEVLVAPRPQIAAGPIDRFYDVGWKARHEAKLLEARSRPVDLVLLGDSITANYELTGPKPLLDYSGVWQRYYADRHALNLGFGGDGAWHLLWRITHGEIDGLAPKAAVVLIGTNDIGWLARTAADTVAGIDAIVTELHRRLPATKVLLVGLLPSDRDTKVRQATAEVNSALAFRYGRGDLSYVIYRDVSAVFLKGSTLDTSLFTDPKQLPPAPALHPTPEGQERMAAALEPTLSALLADRRHDR